MTQENKNRPRRIDVYSITMLLMVAMLAMTWVLLAQVITPQDIVNANFNGQINLIQYRLGKVENILYGLISLVLANVIAHVLDIKNRRSMRK